MTQKEKLAYMATFAARIEMTARNIQSEGEDYDQRWHRKYVTGLVELANEMRSVLKGKK